jgi:hypothetical protein
MEVFDAELWAIGFALDETIKKRETLQRHGVKTVAGFSDSQAAIRRTAHLEPGPGPLASGAKFAWRSASSFPGMPECPGTQWISVAMPWA